jgi:hypothetical protein
MQQGPEVFVSPEDDMSTPSAIAAVRARLRIVFGAHEVFAACATMAGATKDADLVNEI